MTNIFGDVRRLVLAGLDDLVAEGALPAGLDVARVAVEPPRDPEHGDLATNVAMVLAGQAKQNPMALAEKIGAALGKHVLVSGGYSRPRLRGAAGGGGFFQLPAAPTGWGAGTSARPACAPASGGCRHGDRAAAQ